MQAIFFFLFIGCLVLACNNGQRRQPDPKQIEFLVKVLEGSECVHREIIGFAGEESPVYANFERLNRLVTDSFWFKMSFSSSAVMRVYAWQAISTRNKVLAAKVRDRLSKDSTLVCVKSNDFEYAVYVSEIILSTNIKTRNNR